MPAKSQTKNLASNLYTVWADAYYNHSEYATKWGSLTVATQESWEVVAIQAEALLRQTPPTDGDTTPAPSRRRGRVKPPESVQDDAPVPDGPHNADGSYAAS